MTTFTWNRMYKIVEADLSYRSANFVVSIFPIYNRFNACKSQGIDSI